MDPLTIGMFAVLVLMVVFMFRNNRKQKEAREKLQASIVKGADVMTTSGVYGKITAIDVDANEVVIETTPGTKIRFHLQAVSTVVDKEATAKSEAKKPASQAASKPAASKSSAASK
jgi:preprotein translocase subunit YajC